MYLLDTNIVSELRKGDRCEGKVLRWFDKASEDSLFTSVLVIGEIARGIEKLRSRNATEARALNRWLDQIRQYYASRILVIDEPVATIWGRLNARRTLPAIDGLLASTALAHDLILVTLNVADVAGSKVRVLNPFVDLRVRLAH